MRVVFTGPAVDELGQPLLRKDLIEAAEAVGYSVMDKVDKTVTLLVASRTDTVKAKRAAAMGIEVVGYPVFVRTLIDVGAAIVRSNDAPDLFVDLPFELHHGYQKPHKKSRTLRLMARAEEA